MNNTMKQSASMIITKPAALADYVALMKPELTFLSVLTAVGGAYLGMRDAVHYQLLLHTLVGTTLVGGAAGALNQYAERHYDSLMKRTSHRPLPSGSIQPAYAFLFGLALAASGIVYLFLTANAAAGILAAVTLFVYLCLYTPLKRRTPFSTVVGGIAGAIPPLIGWAVVRGTLSMEAWSFFFILFFWQMPHFLSLAWMYRKDYARAGYKLLVVVDSDGSITARQILIYCCALIPASLLPAFIGVSGYVYFTGALIVTVFFLATGFSFFRTRSVVAAKRIFYYSLTILPLLFLAMMLA
jgi:heme o synthase